MKPRCICSGILFADVACWPIDHLPVAGEMIETERIELNLGGCASNVALDLSKLEVPVILSGYVGDDAFSDFILKAVAAPGVETSLVGRVPNAGPGTAMHINVQGQDRRFVCTTGANDDYTIDNGLRGIVVETGKSEPKTKVLYLGGFLMLRSLENEATAQFLRLARENGWKTVLDVVPYGKRNYWDAVRPLLPYVDIFMPNDTEAELICGKKDSIEQAKCFLEAGAKTALITQGEKGTLYYSDDLKFQADIFRTEFVSGAGSGDAFAAGLIAAMLEDLSPEECITWGSALGASCVRGVSTTGSVFTRREATEFLKENRLAIKTFG